MTRCYLDTNFLYGHFRDRDAAPMVGWRQEMEAELGADSPVVSTLVVDELAYRLTLAWLRDEGDPSPLATLRKSPAGTMRRMRGRLEAVWSAIDDLGLEIAAADRSVVNRATGLMGNPGLAPRDAFHAAHALTSDCGVIVSSDPHYDSVAAIRRLAPKL